MSQDERNVNIEEIKMKCKEAGFGEVLTQFITDDFEFFKNFTDDKFENQSSEEN